MQNELNQYITELNRIYKAGNATEHTYRPALQRLLESITHGLAITNEPKRIACGAPDYIITRKDIPIGYIEAKDIGADLSSKACKEQFDRYKQSLDNLIITDYRIFQLFVNGELMMTATVEQPDAFGDLITHFTDYQGQSIQTSEQLSKLMAAKARLMASIIEQTLDGNVQHNNNSLAAQLNGFKKVLIHDMKAKEFADMYAQTIAYGMFAARLYDDSRNDFSRQRAAELIPLSNPFLRKLFQYIAGYDLDDSIRWVVDALADLFNYVDMDEMMHEFGKSDHDPIIHFYETFLAEYDPALRKSRGVWYTPQPVVKFIVQAVDDILKAKFELPKGLADDSKGDSGDFHKVQLLDPATGTGTFLAEVVKLIYRQFENQQGMWSGYVGKHLIPRLNGFEILMTPYAMAHLKLDMLLRETGYKSETNERLRIYLTNSLEKAHDNNPEIPFAQWLSDEASEASHIKQDVPVMVVFGNPPYSVSSQNKGAWIQSLMADYKTGLNERNIQPLSDDYIKFIRYGQHFVTKNSGGILAYISNNSFIDGLIHRQMRKNLLETFDEIYVLNLHGNAKKKEIAPDGSPDENVFDIQQGASINIFVNTGKKKTGDLAQVFYHDLYGKRHYKYQFLLEKNLQTVKWQKLPLQAPQYFFVPKDFDLKAAYEKGFSIADLFQKSSSGIKTHNDAELISFLPFVTAHNQPIQYRPFDYRFIDYDLSKVVRHRYAIMQHFFNKQNAGLIFSRQFGGGKHFICFVTNTLTEISSQPFAPYNIFPLYLYPESDNLFADEKRKRKPNLNVTIVNEITQRLGLQYTEEKENDETTFAPIDILDYIYAVLHSPKYRERYREFLKIDFPRVPYPSDAAQFHALAAFGSKLRQLHLLEGIEPSPTMATYPKDGSHEVEKTHYADGKVWINDTQYFAQVPPEAWEFYIGGYQPAQKWLKDRKGQALTYDDIRHYQRVIRVLWETKEIQNEIDNA